MNDDYFRFEFDPNDDDWEEPEELTPAALRRLSEEGSRDRSRTPQVDAQTNANDNLDGSDIRKQLEAVGITKITYNILKPGNVWFYNFEIPVALLFSSFRSALITEFKVDQAVQDAAEFQFSLNTAVNKWFGVKDDATWTGSVLKAIYTNFEEREDERRGVTRARKKKTKEALPLTVKIVSSLTMFPIPCILSSRS
jgi:hypothetical protein